MEKSTVELLLSEHPDERVQGEQDLLEEVRSYSPEILRGARIIDTLKPAGHRLSQPAFEECLDFIARTIMQFDGRSHLGYTNKVLYEIYNVLCGGELLDERCTIARGKRRFLSWVNLTALTGAPWEYMSAMYTSTTTGALYSFIRYSKSPEVVFRSQLMLEKVWLHVANHYHHGLRDLAGPYSRCTTFPSVIAGGMHHRIPYFTGWQTFYQEWDNEEGMTEPKTDIMPGYIREIMSQKAFPFWVRETFSLKLEVPPPSSDVAAADGHEWFSLVDSHPRAENVLNARRADQCLRDRFNPVSWGRTYMEEEFSMGSRNLKVLQYGESYAQSSMNLVVQYLKPEAREHPNRWMFARYHNSAAPQTYLGSIIWTNQDHQVALIAGAPEPPRQQHQIEAEELYLYFAFEALEKIEAVYVDGKPIDELPFTVSDGSVVVIEDANIYIGLRPVVMQGVDGFDACAELSAKTFAEISYKGEGYGCYDAVKPLTALKLFDYRGTARALTQADLKHALSMAAIEVHPRKAFSDAKSFTGHLLKASIQEKDNLVTYHNCGRTVSLSRRFADPVDDCPANDAEGPNYVQNRTGQLAIKGAEVECNSPTPMGLAVTPSGKEYVLLHLGDHPVDVHFRCQDFEIFIEGFDFGRVRFFPEEKRHEVNAVKLDPDSVPYW